MADSTAPDISRPFGYTASILAALILVGIALTVPAVVDGRPVLFALDWAPSLGISLAFMVDGLSLIFGLLISGIGSLIFLYATGYMGNHPQFGRFVLFLFAFMVSMLGLVLARDLITLFLFWELTSITSYLLIGFDHNNPRARRNALQAMLVTAGGGLALLAGKTDQIEMTHAAIAGAALLLIGEIGLWVGAACLGLTLFKKRKAMLNRLLGRRPAAPSEV